jgi:hypothetical protein
MINRGLVKAYEDGKAFGKKWKHNGKDEKGKRGGDYNPHTTDSTKDKKTAWMDGFEDGRYPSEARKDNPYLKESKFEKYLLEAKNVDYMFVIDADERGEFSAHIENENGKIKFNWSKEDCEEAGGFPPVVDGFMKNIKDMNGLRDYLKLPNLMWVG